MGVTCDRWTVLKLFEVLFTAACLIAKRVTDDEASRLFLYLQKLSREWRLLNNVTWDRVGSSVADATYGGYIIITFALFIGRLIGELPTRRRVTEFILLGIGTILFVILGSLEFAALDSVPENLVDNAAILGTLTLVTAALFLLDMGGPKGKKPVSKIEFIPKTSLRPSEVRQAPQQVYDIETDFERIERRQTEDNERSSKSKRENGRPPDERGDHRQDNRDKRSSKPVQNGYKQMRDQKPKHFDIYGKDMDDDYKSESETDVVSDSIRGVQEHSPVWSKIRKGRPLVDYVDNRSSRQYERYDIAVPEFDSLRSSRRDDDRPPSGPGDPGFVQYAAQHWGEHGLKTPKHSPV